MIKITGGKLKGRSFKPPNGMNTRPTSAKVREAIFNILNADVLDSVWLDLFAGSGSISFEAISRGAKEVYAIEQDKQAFTCLKNNVENLALKEVLKIFKTDSITFLNKLDYKFDIIFIDPPYASDLYIKTMGILNKKELLNPNGLVLIEHSTKYMLPELKYTFIKNYKYGDTSLSIFRYLE
ncbi:MAG: 16S rRNA (guanine(966)-N(2))-methyltransferase RsmD [Candidatus Sericytochromatia bacterium]